MDVSGRRRAVGRSPEPGEAASRRPEIGVEAGRRPRRRPGPRLWAALGAAGLLLGLEAPPAFAADAAVTLGAELSPGALAPGEAGVLRVRIEVPAGWHLWSLDPGPGPMALQLIVDPGAPIALDGPWHGPAPKRVFDKGFERELDQYGDGVVVLERRVTVLDRGLVGDVTVPITLRGQICTEATCLTQKASATANLQIVETPTGAEPPALAGAPLPARGAAPLACDGTETDAAAIECARQRGILPFLLLAFLAGLGALATPCVFPAIPMTVSFFSKYSKEDFGHGARLAAFYAVSMMVYFTLAGLLVSALFGVTGIQRFAAHPIFNLALGGVLAFFALSLMGWFKIGTPMWALNLTNKLEMKYGPMAQADDGAGRGRLGDYVAVGVAAMTATTVFFTCTVAFVGVVLVAAADGEWFWPTLGMLAFSAAFVLPFFLLALFPAAAQRLRGKTGNWIKAFTVTLGFVELAAAFKFFSNADLVLQTYVLSRDVVLTIWIALFALCGLFLIGKLDMRAPDEPEPDAHVAVPRVLAGAATFAFTLFLGLGLFHGRPLGGWLDGWLPPPSLPGSPEAVAGGAARGPTFAWIHSLEEGRAKAKTEGRLVFVNYTGFTCTNCRYMESGVFPRPEIAGLLDQMTLVELYTDGLEPQHEAAREDQLTRFGTAALPFYSIERPDGTVLAKFPSSTNDPEEFRRFLADALLRAKAEPKTPAAAAAPVSPMPRLRLTRLDDGARGELEPGKWTLVNFWATWCAPCREELQSFLARVGRDVEARGGRFLTVAVEEDESVADALAFMRKVGVPDASAWRLPAEPTPEDVDPRLGFKGEQLPFTVLVSPEGKVVWTHESALDEAGLVAVLTEHMGFAALR